MKNWLRKPQNAQTLYAVAILTALAACVAFFPVKSLGRAPRLGLCSDEP